MGAFIRVGKTVTQEIHGKLTEAGKALAEQLLREAQEIEPLTLYGTHRSFSPEPGIDSVVEGSLVEPIVDPARLLEEAE